MSAPMHDRPVGQLGIRLGFAAAIVIAFTALLSFGAADPGAMTQPAIGPVPLSLVLAAAMICFAVALTGLYVVLANNRDAR